jgi:hypothetical protein
MNGGDRRWFKSTWEKKPVAREDDLMMMMMIIIIIISMWNVKTRVIPVIIEAAGTISKSFRKCVSTIPGNHEVKELQKTAILGTAHTHFGKR